MARSFRSITSTKTSCEVSCILASERSDTLVCIVECGEGLGAGAPLQRCCSFSKPFDTVQRDVGDCPATTIEFDLVASYYSRTVRSSFSPSIVSSQTSKTAITLQGKKTLWKLFLNPPQSRVIYFFLETTLRTV